MAGARPVCRCGRGRISAPTCSGHARRCASRCRAMSARAHVSTHIYRTASSSPGSTMSMLRQERPGIPAGSQGPGPWRGGAGRQHFRAGHVLHAAADECVLPPTLCGPRLLLRLRSCSGRQSCRDRDRPAPATRDAMRRVSFLRGQRLQHRGEILICGRTDLKESAVRLRKVGPLRTVMTVSPCARRRSASGEAEPVAISQQEPGRRVPVGGLPPVVPGQAFPGGGVEPSGDIRLFSGPRLRCGGCGAGSLVINPVAGAFERIAGQRHPTATRLGDSAPVDGHPGTPEGAEACEQGPVVLNGASSRGQGGKGLYLRSRDPASHACQRTARADFQKHGVRVSFQYALDPGGKGDG